MVRKKLDLINARDGWMHKASSAPNLEAYSKTGPPSVGEDPALARAGYWGMVDDGRPRFAAAAAAPGAHAEYHPRLTQDGRPNTVQGSLERTPLRYAALRRSLNGEQAAAAAGRRLSWGKLTSGGGGGFARGYTPTVRTPLLDRLVDRVHDPCPLTSELGGGGGGGGGGEEGGAGGARSAFADTQARFGVMDRRVEEIMGPGLYEVDTYKKFLEAKNGAGAPSLYKRDREPPAAPPASASRTEWLPAAAAALSGAGVGAPAHSFARAPRQDAAERVPWQKKMGPILGPWSDYHRKAWSKKVYLSQAPKLMEPKQYHNVSTDGIKADKGSLAEAARRGPREYAAAFRGARRDLAKTQLLPSYGDGPGQFEVPAALRAVAVRAPGRESEAFRRRPRVGDVVVYGSNWASLQPRYEISEAIWSEHMGIGAEALRRERLERLQRSLRKKKKGGGGGGGAVGGGGGGGGVGTHRRGDPKGESGRRRSRGAAAARRPRQRSPSEQAYAAGLAAGMAI